MPIITPKLILDSVEIDTIGWCWNWKRTTPNEDGYTAVYDSVARKQVKSHRASYETFKGAIPDGLVIDHLCRNTICVNPDHLDVVTNSENSRRRAYVKQAFCKRGHPFTPENTMRQKGYKGRGGRVCKTCKYDRDRTLAKRPDRLPSKRKRARDYYHKNREKIRAQQNLQRSMRIGKKEHGQVTHDS